jgi:splicing factor 3B subunit 2
VSSLWLQAKLRRWGELEEEEESSEEESSEEEPEVPLTQEQVEQGIASGMMTGLASSLEGGIDTNATLELRKASGTATTGATPALYTVLEQQEAGLTEGLAATGHTYKIVEGNRPAAPGARKRYVLGLCMLQAQASFFPQVQQ